MKRIGISGSDFFFFPGLIMAGAGLWWWFGGAVALTAIGVTLTGIALIATLRRTR